MLLKGSFQVTGYMATTVPAGFAGWRVGRVGLDELSSGRSGKLGTDYPPG